MIKVAEMTVKSPTVESTVEFIKRAHAGQTDHGGKDYWHHPYAVMQLLSSPSDDERMAALLHDVLEDTDYSEQDLRNLGYSQAVVDMCSWLNFDHSRYAGMTYMEKIQHLKDNAPKGAVKVKIADNGHNSDAARGFSDKEKNDGLMKRYARARKILTQ